jgi:hypothetical protein
VLVIDTRTLRRLGSLALPLQHIAGTAWPRPDRLLVGARKDERTVGFVLVDPGARRVLREASEAGARTGRETRDGLALLVG